MKIKTLGTIAVALLLISSLFVVQADDKKKQKDPRSEKFHAAEKEINAAVKAGKLSKADAQKKLGAIKKQIWADKGKEQNRDRKDPRAEKFRAAEEKIWAAVKAGKLSKEAANKKLAGLKREIWGGDQKKDSGDKKKGSGDKKEGYDKREAKFRSFEKEILGAVKAGKFSKEAAMKKLEGLKDQIWGGDLKKDSGDKKEGYDKREAKFRSFEKEIWGAVKAGKLSKEDAMKKLEGLKDQIWGGDLKKDSGNKKKGYDKREAKFHAFEKEIWGAVKAGKLSKEDAQKKLAGLKKGIWGGDQKKDSGDKKGSGDKNVETLRRQLEALKRENEGLRKRLKERKDR